MTDRRLNQLVWGGVFVYALSCLILFLWFCGPTMLRLARDPSQIIHPRPTSSPTPRAAPGD